MWHLRSTRGVGKIIPLCVTDEAKLFPKELLLISVYLFLYITCQAEGSTLYPWKDADKIARNSKAFRNYLFVPGERGPNWAHASEIRLGGYHFFSQPLRRTFLIGQILGCKSVWPLGNVRGRENAIATFTAWSLDNHRSSLSLKAGRKLGIAEKKRKDKKKRKNTCTSSDISYFLRA